MFKFNTWKLDTGRLLRLRNFLLVRLQSRVTCEITSYSCNILCINIKRPNFHTQMHRNIYIKIRKKLLFFFQFFLSSFFCFEGSGLTIQLLKKFQFLKLREKIMILTLFFFFLTMNELCVTSIHSWLLYGFKKTFFFIYLLYVPYASIFLTEKHALVTSSRCYVRTTCI